MGLQVTAGAVSAPPPWPSLDPGQGEVGLHGSSLNRQLEFVRKKAGDSELRARHTEVLKGTEVPRAEPRPQAVDRGRPSSSWLLLAWPPAHHFSGPNTASLGLGAPPSWLTREP